MTLPFIEYHERPTKIKAMKIASVKVVMSFQGEDRYQVTFQGSDEVFDITEKCHPFIPTEGDYFIEVKESFDVEYVKKTRFESMYACSPTECGE